MVQTDLPETSDLNMTTFVVNRKLTVDQNIQRIESSYCKCVETFKDYPDLLEYMRELADYGKEIASFAHEYDFSEDIQGNGYRSMIDSGLLLFKYGCTHYREGDEDFIKDYISLVRNFRNGIKYVKRLREDTKENHQLESGLEILVDTFWEYASALKEREVNYSMVGTFAMGDLMSKILNFGFIFQSMSKTDSLASSIKCLYDHDHRRKVMVEASNKYVIENIKDRFNFYANNVFSRSVYPWLVNGSKPKIAEDHYLKRQKRIQLILNPRTKVPELIRTDEPMSDTVIYCRLLLEPTESGKVETLLINVHGGGFSIGTVYSNEIYLRYMATRIPGMAVLSIDISLAPEAKFPTQIQEIIDVYLFITQSPVEEVISQLGFYPSRIILSGDSSGSCLVLSSLVTLNEIKKQWPEELKQMPVALYAFYPSFSINPVMRPSYLMCGFSTILNPLVLACFGEAYIPEGLEDDGADSPDVNANIERKDDDDENEEKSEYTITSYAVTGATSLVKGVVSKLAWVLSLNPSLTLDEERRLHEEKGGKKPRHLLQKDDIMAQVMARRKVTTSPFASPLCYQDMESLSDVHLLITACAPDPVLDHAITLAKMWKGPVVLDVVNQPHAFMNLMALKTPREGVKLVITRLKSLLETLNTC